MTNLLDQVVLDQLTLNLEKTFIRFETGEWFKLDGINYVPVVNSTFLEDIYTNLKNNS